MYLRELAKVAIEHGETKHMVGSTLNPLIKTFLGILERRHNIRRGDRNLIYSEDKRKWDILVKQSSQKQPGITVEELLEEYPDAFERTRIREFAPSKEKFFTYLLQRYYQPTQDVYERRDTYGGEYDI